jgi:hypothetical protein
VVNNLETPINWNTPVKLKWEYQTSIFRNNFGTETRSADREFPRRGFEFAFVDSKGARQGYRQRLASTLAKEVRIPDVLTARSALCITANSISIIDYTPFVAIGEVLAVGFDSTTSFCTIESIDGDVVTFTSDETWGIGRYVRVMNTVTSVVSDSLDVTALNSAVKTGTGVFTSQPYATPVEDLGNYTPEQTYRGKPLVLWEPNWAQGVKEAWSIRTRVNDFGFGKRNVDRIGETPDRNGRYSIVLRDIGKIREIVDFFTWCRGKQASFYAPTWVDDFTFDPVVEGQTILSCPGTGLADLYSRTETFGSLCMRKAGQMAVFGIAGANVVAGRSRIELSGPITADFVGCTSASWLIEQRFATDVLEMDLITNRVGVVNLNFVSVFEGFTPLQIRDFLILFNGDYVTMGAQQDEEPIRPITLSSDLLTLNGGLLG